MKIKGRLLYFDQWIMDDHIFPRDCKINIPEKVPLTFDFSNDQKVLGTAHVERDEKGLIVTADVYDDAAEMVKGFESEFALGGLYNKCKFTHNQKGTGKRVVEYAELKAVSITPYPVNKDYDYEIIYEENLHAEDSDE